MSFTFCVFARSKNSFLSRKFIAWRMRDHAPLPSLDPNVDCVPNALVFHEIRLNQGVCPNKNYRRFAPSLIICQCYGAFPNGECAMTRYDAAVITISPAANNHLAIDVIVKGGDRLLISVSDSQLRGLVIVIESILERLRDISPDHQDQSKDWAGLTLSPPRQRSRTHTHQVRQK